MKNSVDKLYFNRPKLWEHRNQHRFEPECAFLHQLFQKYGLVKTVLDVGCGTGGHLAILKRKYGYEVTGVDLSESMIRYAREILPEANFYVMDMQDLTLSETFDAVICLHSTFPYNTTNEQILQTLDQLNLTLTANTDLGITFPIRP